jgi:hypothetical protein
MGVLKSGGLLLILAIPLGLDVAREVNGVVRTDLVLSEPPPDRGASKEQLAAAHTKVSAWAGDVRKAVAVAQQYRAPGPDDACTDPDASALVKISAVRSADLNDLDLFLSELERPTFTGKMKGLYQQWMDGRKELKRDAEAINVWLNRKLKVTSAADAQSEMTGALDLINKYENRSKFSDKSKAATWRVQARLLIVKALKDEADTQYRAAVLVKLPLDPVKNNVKTAMDTLHELKELLTGLAADLRKADEEKAPIDAPVRAEAERKGGLADECAARAELLKVFAKDDLFTNPNGAGPWLKRVVELYRRTKDDNVRELIRGKVQEFCDAFIPHAVRLDEKVLLRGQELPRAEIIVKFEATVGTSREPKRGRLSDTIEGLTEFNLEALHPGTGTFVVFDRAEERPGELKPTKLSEVAVAFNRERKKLADSTTVPKWSAKSVEELKKKCEAQRELVDLLKTPGSVSPPKIWTRLSGLASGMVGCAELFESGGP